MANRIALGGSVVAALLVFYLNIKHTAWHCLVHGVVKQLKQNRERTKPIKR